MILGSLFYQAETQASLDFDMVAEQAEANATLIHNPPPPPSNAVSQPPSLFNPPTTPSTLQRSPSVSSNASMASVDSSKKRKRAAESPQDVGPPPKMMAIPKEAQLEVPALAGSELMAPLAPSLNEIRKKLTKIEQEYFIKTISVRCSELPKVGVKEGQQRDMEDMWFTSLETSFRANPFYPVPPIVIVINIRKSFPF